MHDLFISYAREDEAWVGRFGKMLEAEELVVWKDSAIPTGKSFGRVIEEAITNSRALVVVWSHYSIESDWVRAEATEGLKRGILMPVRRDKTAPPLRFRTIQTIDLSGWKFDQDDSAFRRLVDELKELIKSVPPGAPTGEQRQTQTPASAGSNARRYPMAVAALLLAVVLGVAAWLWSSGGKRSQLAIELTAASTAALDEVASNYNSSGHYWGYFLARDGGQSLVDRSVLLALEAVNADATPQTIEALHRSLLLLRRPLREFSHANSPRRAAIAPGGTRIAWSHRSGIQMIDTLNEAKNRNLDSDGRVAGLAFLADADYLAVVGNRGRLEVWNLATGKKVSDAAGTGENTVGFALDAAGSRVAVRQSGLVTVRELPSGQRVATIETDRFVNLSAIQSLDLSPDGAILAFAPKDQVVVWDLEKGRELYRISVGRRASGLSIDPDGKHLLAFSTDGEAHLVNLAYGDANKFALDRGGELIRFSPAGAHVAFTAGNRVWVSAQDDPTRIVLKYGHADNIRDIRFSEDGRLIASAGQDGMVRVWDIDAASELTRFAYMDQVIAIRFSKDGKKLTAIARSGQVGVWPVVYEDPAIEACRGLQRNLTPAEWRRHLHPRPYRETCAFPQP